jgi:hypothetical protein
VRKYLVVAAGLSVGNFIFQAATGHNWGIAMDRSLFQMVALGCAWLAP